MNLSVGCVNHSNYMKPLRIKLPKLSRCFERFVKVKYISFIINTENENAVNKYSEIWDEMNFWKKLQW